MVTTTPPPARPAALETSYTAPFSVGEISLPMNAKTVFEPLLKQCVKGVLKRKSLSFGTTSSRFNQLLGDTIKQAANQASNGGADKKFATRDANFTSFITLYTLAQCTPDLSVQDCNTCLEGAIANLPICCDGKQGGRVLIASCNIRYEVYPFYQNTSQSVRPPSPTPKGKSTLSTGTILAIVIPIVLSLLLFFFICCWLILTRKAKKKCTAMPEESVEISNEDLLQLDLDTIKVATNNFCEDNKLGEGGFGEVYKGTLPNRIDIAVKRLSSGSRQGGEEFKNEVDVYSYGILVLEILSGKKNTSFNESGNSEDLLNYAWKNWKDGTPLALLDATLESCYSRDEVIRCIHIGLLCVQEDPVQRPTMQQIVLMLNSYSTSLAMPERPPSFLVGRTQPSFPTMGLDSKSTSKSVSASVDEASITGVYPR
ncbi:hypothetical protein L6164_032165 [Bauhinia variegata]|uniref:Uncharacterized protein n=1 Tax=Bauhinia variegata TaxID=167791 RepID=A0ACB9KMV9_BAUVA|nr:hypothetical protein L6164_032165 [Bauhinia variegata]